jgi:hypothetical protein
VHGHDKSGQTSPKETSRARSPYTTPALIEYGSVAKLTQSSGSTTTEGTIVAKQMKCL